ncbi:MAG: hypothetical protein JSU63_19020 [Phycisphaerales bacterium]|nr:MAG: hypothetical protein JSU63_19020 [Phycisphaerales bacterium]
MADRRIPALPILFIVALTSVLQAQSPIDLELAEQYFDEARVLSECDGGRMWGTPLYGPMFFVDRATRAVVANQADQRGFLKQVGPVFVGTLPPKEMIANAATKWAGVTWTMVMWPLPADAMERQRLMAHESWHRIQDQLGFPGSDPANDHLDTREGRIWLQLEWRALKEALLHSQQDRKRATEDALTFRAYRRFLFPESAGLERALEMHEGLAEYTGIRLAAESAAASRAAKNLKEAEKRETFVRSFAYASGPAYGVLLDATKPNWREGLSVQDDLGELLRAAMSISLSRDLAGATLQRAERYDSTSLISVETERDKARQARLAMYRRRFVEGPALTIPFRQGALGFNPNNLQPLDDLGTVYPTMKVVDVWGILTVTGGALLGKSWGKIIVPSPQDPNARPLSGDGWTLELNEGWTTRGGRRKGDYVLTAK